MPEQVLNLSAVKSALPYRYPMLMLDRVCLESDAKAWAVKNLSIDELFFQGHFPGHPILPGVLQVEAMKQLCEILAAPKIDPAGEGHIYIRLLEKVKFRSPNLPGDRMKIDAELLSCENGEAVFKATTANASGLTCEARITLAVRSKKIENAMPKLYNDFDRSATTALPVEQVQALLPHRYPFLLVDYIAKTSENGIVAVKNLAANEELLTGCPEDYIALSESFQCEIVAQAGCACVLARPENKGKLGYFMTIDRAESVAPIFPGDQLVCDIQIPPSKGRFGKGAGSISVDGKEVFKITLMFAIVEP